MASNGKSKVILRGVKRDSLRETVRECLELCHWQDIVPENATVIIKPNLCTADADKVEMANTDPALTEAVCEVLKTRTNRIWVGESDHLRHPVWKAFEVSGYVEMARRVGVELMNFSQVPWKAVPLHPTGEIELPRPLLEADVFITLPVLKTHALTYFTGALKNQWGCLPQYNRILYHKDLDELLVSLQRVLHPKLVVMDGIVGVEGRGPANGKPRRLDIVLASADAIALDATAARLVGLQPERSRHITLAGQCGLGAFRSQDINVDGDWARHATQFEPAVLDRAIRAMNFMTRYRWFVTHMLERDTIFYPVRAVVQALRRVGVVEGG